MILTHYYHRNDKPFQTLSSLHENEFGIHGEEWRTDEKRKYDLFIEAQVWDSCSTEVVF